MESNIIFTSLLLLLFATELYTPIKASQQHKDGHSEIKMSKRDSRKDNFHEGIKIDNTKVDTMSIYVKNSIIISCWIRKSSFKCFLIQDVINMITYYTENPLAYLFIGPSDSGKSTAIFALQRSKVARYQSRKKNNNDHLGRNIIKKSNLIFEKNIPAQNPTIGYSNQGNNVYATICSHLDVTKNIAFCETEDFFNKKDSVRNTRREQLKLRHALEALLAGGYSIGGIVVVINKSAIASASGDILTEIIHILGADFVFAGDTALRKSICLMITKCTNDEEKQETAQIILHHKNARDGIFGMPLTNPVTKKQENNLDNLRLDKERVLFFDPCNPASVEETAQILNKLHSMETRQLVKFLDNSQSIFRNKLALLIFVAWFVGLYYILYGNLTNKVGK